jgi:hypothetical protein
MSGTDVWIDEPKWCDFCQPTPVVAIVDGATRDRGPWANMCVEHFAQYGIGIGTGVGQRLHVRDNGDDNPSV